MDGSVAFGDMTESQVVGQFEICDGVYVSDGRSGPN
jgi:hypothetical protein